MARGTIICLKHLVLEPYFQDQTQCRSWWLGMRLAVSRCKPSAQSALLIGPAFSILPTSCRESAGQGNCQDRNGELDGHRLTGYTRTAYSRLGAKCTVVCWFSCSLWRKLQQSSRASHTYEAAGQRLPGS